MFATPGICGLIEKTRAISTMEPSQSKRMSAVSAVTDAMKVCWWAESTGTLSQVAKPL